MFNLGKTCYFCPLLPELVADLSKSFVANSLAIQLGPDIHISSGNQFDGLWPIPVNSSLPAKATTHVPVLRFVDLQWHIAELHRLRLGQWAAVSWFNHYLA